MAATSGLAALACRDQEPAAAMTPHRRPESARNRYLITSGRADRSPKTFPLAWPGA